MDSLVKNLSFHSINMLGMLEHNASMASRVFNSVTTLLRKRVVKPIQLIITLPISQLEDALRRVQEGKLMGKIVLESNNSDLVPVSTTFAMQSSIPF